MKRLLLLVFMMMPLMLLQAMDSGKVKVKRKKGATIIGELKSLDPLDKIVMFVAEQETTIPMSEVEIVEMIQETTITQKPKNTFTTPNTTGKEFGYTKLVVTETKSYKERITLKLDDLQLEMILVPGGDMNMGYDGSGSLSMKSEPIHKVSVTSFYISTQPLPAWYVTKFIGAKGVESTGSEPAEVPKFKNVEAFMSILSQEVGGKLRLPTEAEWEYAACSEQQDEIFKIAAQGNKAAYEWCSDFWGEFSNSNYGVIDPEGPSKGNQHVVRAYNARRGKFDRSNEAERRCYQGLIRLVVKAVDI